jgi:hypothetical protein
MRRLVTGDRSLKLESDRADTSFEVPAHTLTAATDPALTLPTVSDCA